MAKKIVPIYTIEEHNEAFLLWHHAIAKGFIPAKNNTLLHVDEHSDMGNPRVNESFDELGGDIKKVRQLTFNELSIANFIKPAIYLGIINKVYWIRQDVTKARFKQLFVKSLGDTGRKLISGAAKSLRKVTESKESKIQIFSYFQKPLSAFPKNSRAILDIDLDYFSCSGDPVEDTTTRIEITQAEYENFISNPYHKIRFFGHHITAEKQQNHYFFLINDFKENYQYAQKVNEQKVLDRIDSFINELVDRNVKPGIITLCRSRLSGYTPSDQWNLIENKLLDKLALIYPLEAQEID